MQGATQKFHRAFNGVLGVVPGLVLVAIIKFFAKPAYVLLKLLHIAILDSGGYLFKFGIALFVKLFLSVFKHSRIVGKAKIGLSLKLFWKVLVTVPKYNCGFYHMLKVKFYPSANKAG